MTHSHTHGLGHDGPARPHALRLALAVIIPSAVLTLVGLVWLWPTDTVGPEQPASAPRFAGEVLQVAPEPCPPSPEGEGPSGAQFARCGSATVKLTEGPDAGKQIAVEIPSGPGAPTVVSGDDVLLLLLEDTEGQTYQIVDHQRGTPLWLFGLAFAAAVIAFGRWRGLSALVGLAATFAALLLFIVPAILAGEPALAVAIVGSAAIMLVVLYLTHGFSVPTSIAVVGTLSSLAITGLLAVLATRVAHLTGVADETSSYVNITNSAVNMQGLLLAGIIIGSLGVLDDVTVTQAVTVDELSRANPAYGFRQLYRAATRVGRAHIASVINTIILAYAGASLPLLLLIAADTATPLGAVLTNQLIAQEILRSIVATLGLIAAVPITTVLASLAAHRLATAEPLPAESPPEAVLAETTPVPPSARTPQTPHTLSDAWADDDELGWPR